MPADEPDDETAPPQPPAPHDAEQALRTMAHDARNGLAAIVGRAQLFARRLRRGDPTETERAAHDAAEIERIARRTAARIAEIEEGARTPRARRSGSGPLTHRPDHDDNP